jgi:hypothetical protein
LALVDGSLVGFVGHIPTNPTSVLRTSAYAPGTRGGRRDSLPSVMP